MTPHSQLLFATPPAVTNEAELHALVSELYGPIQSWFVLPGESDLNVRVALADGVGMLKVSDADGTGFAEFQTRLIEHLSVFRPELPVPRIIRTVDGNLEAVSNRGFDSQVHLRMTTFLPGVSARNVTLSPSLMWSIGATQARLHQAFVSFDTVLPERPTNWDLLAIKDRMVTGRQSDSEEQRQWDMILTEFGSTCLPRLRQLPVQFIHNDINGSNLLVDPSATSVTGVFDMGDVSIAPRVVDIGVAGAYLVDDSRLGTLTDSLAALVHGYHSVWPLEPDEVELVPQIMKARYALALTLNSARAEAAHADPAYVEYVTRNSEGSRRRLAAVLAAPTADLRRALSCS